MALIWIWVCNFFFLKKVAIEMLCGFPTAVTRKRGEESQRTA